MVGVQRRRVARKAFYARKLDRGSSRGGEVYFADSVQRRFPVISFYVFR